MGAARASARKRASRGTEVFWTLRRSRSSSADSAGSPRVGAECHVDSNVALDTKELAEEPARFSDYPLASFFGHRDNPTQGAQQSDHVVGVERDIPSERFVVRSVEADAGRDLQARDRTKGVTQDEVGEFDAG
jgi:hypothetical protein